MISVQNLTKYFHKGSINEVLALVKINLDIRKGDFITIIGSNGAGKSTFLNCIAGMYFLDGGSIRLNDQDISSWPEYRRARFIGRVFQDPLVGTCAALSIEQNLALALQRGKQRGLRLGVKSQYRTLFKVALKKLDLGLEDRLRDGVGLLSGGQRQALTMIMATLIHPELLLLDEHTAALDPKTANQILQLTQQIVEEQKLTTMMVTHNMSQAIRYGNRLIMFHRGRIIFDISGQEKEMLRVEDLLAKFYQVQGEELSSDRMLLS